jgi:hypothetical protein
MYRCYQIITGKDNQMNWIRAQKRCQENGGDLFVIRSQKEVISLKIIHRDNNHFSIILLSVFFGIISKLMST